MAAFEPLRPLTLDVDALVDQCLELIVDSTETIGRYAADSYAAFGSGAVIVYAGSPSELAGFVGLLGSGRIRIPLDYYTASEEVEQTPALAPYDPETHYHLRIRVAIRKQTDADGQVICEGGCYLLPRCRRAAVAKLVRSGWQAAPWMRGRVHTSNLLPGEGVGEDGSPRAAAGTEIQVQVCLVCASPCSDRCRSCQTAAYCSSAHQKADWRRHRGECAALRALRREKRAKAAGFGRAAARPPGRP